MNTATPTGANRKQGLAIYARLAVLVLLTTLMSTAFAASVKHTNLVDLMTHAESIVVGQIDQVEDGFDANGVPYTEVTLKLAEQIRGSKSAGDGETYTFRQFGLLKPRTMSDGRVNMNLSPEGWSKYGIGEEVTLFLYSPARLTGLRTTVGLQQGKIKIHNNKIKLEGKNAGLFENVSISSNVLNKTEQDLFAKGKSKKDLDAQEFIKLIRRAEKENWIAKGSMKHES